MATKKKSLWEPETAPCPFENDEFLELWVRLLKMPKWVKKPVSAIELACIKLKRYDIDFAASLVENAIIGNYQGIVFADTDQRYETWKYKNNQSNGTATNRPNIANGGAKLGTSDARIKKAGEW